jgi:hypothetical protein
MAQARQELMAEELCWVVRPETLPAQLVCTGWGHK